MVRVQASQPIASYLVGKAFCWRFVLILDALSHSLFNAGEESVQARLDSSLLFLYAFMLISTGFVGRKFPEASAHEHLTATAFTQRSLVRFCRARSWRHDTCGAGQSRPWRAFASFLPAARVRLNSGLHKPLRPLRRPVTPQSQEALELERWPLGKGLFRRHKPRSEEIFPRCVLSPIPIRLSTALPSMRRTTGWC